MRMTNPAEGTPDAEFATYFREHHGHLSAYVRRRCDEALVADVVSEAFLIAWRRRAESSSGGRAWLFKTARLVMNNSMRAERRQQRLGHRLASLQGSSVRASEDSTTEAEVVLRTLRRMSEPDREVLMLVHWEDLGGAELGEALGCSAATAAVRLHRARKRFRRALTVSSASTDVPHSLKEIFR